MSWYKYAVKAKRNKGMKNASLDATYCGVMPESLTEPSGSAASQQAHIPIALRHEPMFSQDCYHPTVKLPYVKPCYASLSESQDERSGSGKVGKMDFFASALVQHAWEHDYYIDWTSTCVVKVESHYHSRLSRDIHRQPSSLNRDRGTLPDMYDFIILIALHHLKQKPYN